jgi:predicted dehydrogenase
LRRKEPVSIEPIPDKHLSDKLMNRKINWGIVGLGKIANTFAADLRLSKNSIIRAVASRNIEKAKSFSEKYNAVNFYGSYEELVANPEVDVVYVATPHAFHFEHTMMCLKEGKGVLCEKPLGMKRSEVEVMIREAKTRNLFLMEGLWTRFIPATEKVLEIIDNKTIGDLMFVRADFGFKADPDFESRIYKKSLGAGSLLDIGIYPIYLSLLTLGVPNEIKAMARMTDTDVDSYCSMLFGYENGAKAILDSTIEADTPVEAYIYGNKGTLKLHSRFHHTEKLTMVVDRVKTEQEIKYDGNGYIHQIEEVNRCLMNGETESSKIPLTLSADLIGTIDRVKAEIGLKY